MIWTALAALTLAGCAGTAGRGATPESGPAGIVVKGVLTYRERVALPSNARLVLECREGTSADGPLLAASASDLGGKQVPIPFELTVPRSRLVPGRLCGVRAAVFVDGLPQWVLHPEAIDTSADSLDLGTRSFHRLSTGDFRSVLSCGEERVGIRYRPGAMLLAVGEETFEMRHVPAASGARYEAVGDSTTTLWNKGDRTLVTIRGRRLAECTSGSF